MKFILGKKIEMTQIFNEKGDVNPITLIDVASVKVTQILTKDKNGYDAIQIGIGQKKLNKPMRNHLKGFVDNRGRGYAFLKEFRIDKDALSSAEESKKLKKGDTMSVDQFEIGDIVTVRGTTKGKGFQGVVKRWNFKGGPKSHGQKHTLRTPGSIGSAYPQRVLKGLKMAGHMGNKKKSILNLKIVYIDKKNSMLGVRGAIPGNRGGYLEIIKR